MSTLLIWHNRFSKNENEVVEAHIPQHRDSKTKKPRNGEKKPKKTATSKFDNWNTMTEKQTNKRQHCDPRHFFRGQKVTTSIFQDWKTITSRFQDQKATTSNFFGILTLMPLMVSCLQFSSKWNQDCERQHGLNQVVQFQISYKETTYIFNDLIEIDCHLPLISWKNANVF